MNDKINRHDNNFDFLRLAGALLVIFFTTYGVLGAYKFDPLFRLTNGALTTGSIGVAIFFIISGYLITMSWYKRRNIPRFLWARFLRLVPALAGVALVTIFIIGPLTTHQNLWDYFTSRATWGYLSIITVFFPSYYLPDVFIHNPSNMVNAALWSLPVESTMYLIILALGVLGILYRKYFVTLFTLLILGAHLYINVHTLHTILPVISHDILDQLKLYSQMLGYPLYFMVGSIYYLNQDKIKYDKRLVLMASIVWVLSFSNYELLLLTSFICIPYIVLGIAFTSIPYINGIGSKADISYGLYIFHYPIQQTLLNFFSLDTLTLLIATLLITVPLAWMSWHLIENKALSLKNIQIKNLSVMQKLNLRKVEY
ncbi:acyltransferase family protein [Methanooceanicella nereidis]|uniref:acyltransferase family protein n=1 Tax=Methanooceanicella nereidis TaxID=2052831 RepID=UPI001E48F8E9